MRMSIKVLTLTTIGVAASSAQCFASDCTLTSSCGGLTTAIAVVSALVAVCALVLAALMRREHKRAIINLTAEFQNMLENTQTTINKDIRGLRREIGRLRGGDNNNRQGNDGGEQQGEEGQRRRNDNRRRQYRRPSRNTGDDDAAKNTETEE